MNGAYAGPRAVLEIDLTTGSTHRYDLNDADFADALGGVGLAVLLLERYLQARGLERVDPLGPDNAVVFAAGPFAATPVPAANKHALATLSPLDGTAQRRVCHRVTGPPRCGAADLAALVVRGAAERWTTLVVAAMKSNSKTPPRSSGKAHVKRRTHCARGATTARCACARSVSPANAASVMRRLKMTDAKPGVAEPAR